MKKIKCNVCKYRFSLNKAMVKKVSDSLSLVESIKGQRRKIYSAVDCPNCGCQIILCPRLEEVKEEVKDEENSLVS